MKGLSESDDIAVDDASAVRLHCRRGSGDRRRTSIDLIAGHRKRHPTMKTNVEIKEIIERELLRWPEVTVGQHRFGGREFRVGKLELGHLHGSAVADLPFPRSVRDELVSSGKASPHHHIPNSGWVSFYFCGEEDIPAALALFRRDYERIHRILQRKRTNRSFKELSETKHESEH
jgi:hypothetical protein